VPCPASYSLERGRPSPPSTKAQLEGLEEHGIAAQLLRHGRSTGPKSDSVQFYVDTVGPGAYVEHRLPLVRGEVKMNVIIDSWAIQTGNIVVWDYKSGRFPVSARDNYQLLGYAAAITDHIRATAPRHAEWLEDNGSCVTMNIVQPRVTKEISSWTIPVAELRAHANVIFAAAEGALGEHPLATTGNHCHNCRAILECHSADMAATLSASYSSYTLGSNRDLTQLAYDLKKLRRAASMIKSMTNAIEATVESKLKLGGMVHGFETRIGRGKVVWTKEPAAVRSLGDLYGILLGKDDLITPLQAISAGVPKAMVGRYSKRTPGKRKVQECDDDRIIEMFRRGKV
jgi:hypothetical protein